MSRQGGVDMYEHGLAMGAVVLMAKGFGRLVRLRGKKMENDYGVPAALRQG